MSKYCRCHTPSPVEDCRGDVFGGTEIHLAAYAEGCVAARTSVWVRPVDLQRAVFDRQIQNKAIAGEPRFSPVSSVPRPPARPNETPPSILDQGGGPQLGLDGVRPGRVWCIRSGRLHRQWQERLSSRPVIDEGNETNLAKRDSDRSKHLAGGPVEAIASADICVHAVVEARRDADGPHVYRRRAARISDRQLQVCRRLTYQSLSSGQRHQFDRGCADARYEQPFADPAPQLVTAGTPGRDKFGVTRRRWLCHRTNENQKQRRRIK